MSLRRPVAARNPGDLRIGEFRDDGEIPLKQETLAEFLRREFGREDANGISVVVTCVVCQVTQ